MSKLEPIKKWKMTHTQMVLLHMSGMDNGDIAEQMDCTPQRVSQVINDPQAQRIIEATKAKIMRQWEESVENRMQKLTEDALESVEETLGFRDFVLGTDAKKHQDNTAIKVLQGRGVLGGEDKKSAEVGLDLTTSLATRLATALERSNEMEAKHREEQEIVVEEAEVVSG